MSARLSAGVSALRNVKHTGTREPDQGTASSSTRTLQLKRERYLKQMASMSSMRKVNS